MISRRPGTAGSAASRRRARLALLLLPVVVLAGCDAGSATASAPGAAGEAPQPPAAAGAMAPHLAVAADGSLLLSWLEPDGDGHRLRVARFAGGEWGEPSTVAAGDDFFANWADVPSVVEDGDGTLFAHWLARLGGGTYAYGVELARSDDGGATWRRLGLLHADRSPTEHGFVTLLPAGGGVEAVWLDGRATAGGGAMTLRARRLGGGSAPGPEAVIDDAVCDCCSTAAVATSGGVLVAYRDRLDGEVRDVSVVRRGPDGWSPPAPLHRDGWTIPGCPVNGPALAADGDRVAAAWFTAAGGRPRVLAAASRDAGATWSPPAEVDAGEPLGRVGVALLPGGDAVVSWLAADGGVRLARATAGGRLGAPLVLAVTAASRASGVPRLVAAGGRLHVAWVEADEEGPRRLRFATVEPEAVPS